MRLTRAFIGLSFALLLSGCSQHMMRDMAASSMVGFGNEYISPWFMASDDTDIMCAMGEGMAGMTFPMGPNVDPMIPMLTLASGMCAYERAKEEELRYIRALRKNDSETALDASTMQKRWTRLAAQRQYHGYKAAVRWFGEPGVGSCPKFKDDAEEMSYMFGLFVGLQAFQTDIASGAAVGVPPEVVPKIMNGIQCLDSDKYWGLPDAITAAMDIMKLSPGGNSPELTAAYSKLKRASDMGKAKRVRMVQMLEAILYEAQGNAEKAKEVIRNHVALKKEFPADPALNLLDEMATRGIRLISDKMWTENTGQRTPYLQLGTFWDDSPISESALDIDDLL